MQSAMIPINYSLYCFCCLGEVAITKSSTIVHYICTNCITYETGKRLLIIFAFINWGVAVLCAKQSVDISNRFWAERWCCFPL